MQDSYSVKEIIFGLREEYIKTQRDLQYLRTLCHSNDKNVEDFEFVLLKNRFDNEEKMDIRCKFIQKEDTLRGITLNILKLFRQQFSGYEFGRCLEKNNNEYFIFNKYYNAFITSENKEKFAKVFKEILDSDFVNKFNFGYNLCNSYLHYLYTYPSFIDIGFIENGRKIKYDVKTDRLMMQMSKQIDENLITEMLNYQISKDIFSEYQREMIESSPAIKKEIICDLDKDIQDRAVDLSIREYSDNIVLKKIKFK